MIVVNEEAVKKALRYAPVIYQKHVKGRGEVGELYTLQTEHGEICVMWDESGPVRLRVFKRGPCPRTVDELFTDIIMKAYRVREKARVTKWQAYRLINGDGDSFPGLIVDVYKDIAVLQSSSLAIDKHIMKIARIVKEVTGVDTVAEKSVQRVRAKVGLRPREGLLIGSKKETIVDEEGVKFKVSLEGQKTGLYLDQRENRVFMEKFVEGNFLDAFSYTGGFGLHALKAGAKKVTFVDEDPWALKVLRENLRLNGFEEERAEVVRSDIWPFLKMMLKKGKRWESASYDPPAFIPTKEVLKEKIKDYITLYTLAFKLSVDGGIVALSSCSQPLDREKFLWTIGRAQEYSEKDVRIVSVRGASRDHVIKPGTEYMEYLKFALTIVND